MNRNAARCSMVACLLCAFLLVGEAGASGATTHVFDPVLSLTGTCTTSSVDSVPDPGCPGLHAPTSFSIPPRSVTTDRGGNIYVAVCSDENDDGWIDVFKSNGEFITRVVDKKGLKSIAVDSKGNLYAYTFNGKEKGVWLYEPTEYDWAAGKIAYGDAPTLAISTENLGNFASLDINADDDHLYVRYAFRVREYGSAEEGNILLDESIGFGTLNSETSIGLAVDTVRGRIYAADNNAITGRKVRVFELAPPHNLLDTIDGSATPAGDFKSNKYSLAVDEGSGHLFVYDTGGADVVHEFTADGEYVSTIDPGFAGSAIFGAEIAIDNGPQSPNGALLPKGRYLYVPIQGRSLAFMPSSKEAPTIQSASSLNITEGEAELQARIDPGNAATTYVFEYTTQDRFEAEDFAGAQVGGAGELPASGNNIVVFGSANGLTPGTTYRFQVVATNEIDSVKEEGTFTTYPAPGVIPACPNDEVRTGLSALLPDCRAYELVTPADTNARAPVGYGLFFGSPKASPTGNAVSFLTEGGGIPGFEGAGSLTGDSYLAKRGDGGWSTEITGPNGVESSAPFPGSSSIDQGFLLWRANGDGTALLEGKPTSYVRYPDGHSELLGQGSLGVDAAANGRLIGENGSHILFASKTQLEPKAPSGATQAVYDRTPDGVTHVVSLMPGEVTPGAGQDALYEGASRDGENVAFSIAGTFYLRQNNAKTFEVGKGLTFAGIAEGGRVFYLEAGDLKARDPEGGIVEFSESDDVTPVTVSADGTAAYFVSPSVLTGEANPNGAKPVAGKENLYLSEESVISFVGTVTERDVDGELGIYGGLGLWVSSVGTQAFGRVPARTSSDGSALFFESRADLDGYDSAGNAQVYRYDALAEELDCLSCDPTGGPASGEASLQSIRIVLGELSPFNESSYIENLRPDGRRAFFQSEEALVPGDTDGLQDVYEWEAQGVGSCQRAGGCIYLISSGKSNFDDYLYGVSESGDDVFFRSSDLLLPVDGDETPSIYDARVGGGFPERIDEPCEGEGCRPQVTPPPTTLSAASPTLGGSGNLKKCPKGKREVKRHGKSVCVKKKKHKKHHRKAGTTKKGGRR